MGCWIWWNIAHQYEHSRKLAGSNSAGLSSEYKRPLDTSHSHFAHEPISIGEIKPVRKAVIAYYRVSTARQGASGLGLDAQKKTVKDFLAGRPRRPRRRGSLRSKADDAINRPQLAAALQACRQHHATLVIAKLDRLARDAHFLLGLEKAGVDFVACDMPSANRLTIGILALVAEEEARAISARTKAALADAKARGTILGTPANLINIEVGVRRSVQRRRATARPGRRSASVASTTATEWGGHSFGTCPRIIRRLHPWHRAVICGGQFRCSDCRKPWRVKICGAFAIEMSAIGVRADRSCSKLALLRLTVNGRSRWRRFVMHRPCLAPQ